MDYNYVIQKIRELIGVESVNQFCKKVGLNQANTNAFLNGKKYSISLDDLAAIADTYSVDLNFFVRKKMDTLQKDKDLCKIVNWIEYYWQKSDADERTWFSVQMKKTFPEFKEWLQEESSIGEKREPGVKNDVQSA